MASNKTFRAGPVALTTTSTTNILNCTVTSLAGPVGITLTQPYLIVRHIRVGNKTASAATVALWLGLTGANTAGTECVFVGAASAGAVTQGVSVAANSYVDWYGALLLNAADFLVGGSGTATALTITIEGEVGFIQ